MRWSIIRLVWLRELRDQLRDRRTLCMIFLLPLVLYPVLGIAVLNLALGFNEKPSRIGLVTERRPGAHPVQGEDKEPQPPRTGMNRAAGAAREFPVRSEDGSGRSPASGLTVVGLVPGSNAGIAGAAGAAARNLACRQHLDYPALLVGNQATPLGGRLAAGDVEALLAQALLRFEFVEGDGKAALAAGQVDLLAWAPRDFYARLERAEGEEAAPVPAVEVSGRGEDDHSRQARKRFEYLLDLWKEDLKKVRLARQGLPSAFDVPFRVVDPGAGTGGGVQGQRLVELIIRVFPFMLVMWSLAGALYPAVDVCAGEKERGTMETLLITPAGREEIVLGKFLTIWVFSAASAVLNLLSMGLTTWQFSSRFQVELPMSAVLWCIVLSLPLAALFSAVSLAIGAYARSSKEGQYYLMPLFLVTMPLIFLTMAPGVQLNPFYSLVPVTGVALLMQKLMTTGDLAQVPWVYFLPVLLPIGLYSWLALRWAIDQFQREEVLFREAERLDVKLWLRRLLREKEPFPTYGQALFCFAAILGLRWLATGLGRHLPVAVQASIAQMAFVAAPALFLVLLLNTQPREGLFLRRPKVREIGLAMILAVLLLPPMAALAATVFERFPHLTRLLEDRQPLFQELRAYTEGRELRSDQAWGFLLAFALLPAICEELAFRGLILRGLLQRFRPRTAVIFGGFLFGLYHMNVFQFLPAFFLGTVLGLLTIRSKSLVPAMMLHFLHNAVFLGSLHLARELDGSLPDWFAAVGPYLIGLSLATALGLIWWLYRRPYVELERELAREAAANHSPGPEATTPGNGNI